MYFAMHLHRNIKNHHFTLHCPVYHISKCPVLFYLPVAVFICIENVIAFLLNSKHSWLDCVPQQSTKQLLCLKSYSQSIFCISIQQANQRSFNKEDIQIPDSDLYLEEAYFHTMAEYCWLLCQGVGHVLLVTCSCCLKA